MYASWIKSCISNLNIELICQEHQNTCEFSREKKINNSVWIFKHTYSDSETTSLCWYCLAVCLTEKQHIPILSSLVSPDRGSKPQSTVVEASTLIVTPTVRFTYNTIYCLIEVVTEASLTVFIFVCVININIYHTFTIYLLNINRTEFCWLKLFMSVAWCSVFNEIEPIDIDSVFSQGHSIHRVMMPVTITTYKWCTIGMSLVRTILISSELNTCVTTGKH